MKALRPSSRRGFALLLTLIIVSFAAAIAVLFLLSARQERQGTDSYAQGSRVRQLADTAVNIVMGQINNATREGTAGNPISWASQPGMIRTYNTAGNLSNAYKLYSWPNMTESGSGGSAFNPTAASELPSTTWYTLPMEYTDLNAPVTVYSGGNSVSVYPIADPTVFNTYTGNTISSTSGATSKNNSAGLDWDFYNEVAYENDGANGYAAQSGGNPLPMPVQWLYVLQDGTWVFPQSFSGTNTASFDPTVVTTTNPIVGRIAFWTDDETCKVNLNTAGEGAFWDWPKCAAQDEMQFAADPPMRNEFYRNPGHPGTTSLSAVFPDLFGYNDPSGSGGTVNAFARWSSYTTNGAANPDNVAGMQLILGAVTGGGSGNANGTGIPPRYAYGSMTGAPPVAGSRAGIYPAPYYQTYPPASATNSTGTFSDGSTFYGDTSYSPITLNSSRLYATPDELFFAPPTATASVPRATETFSLNGMSQRSLSQRFFFITTDSRAPETTLFNTPRVSMWPITWPYPSSYLMPLTSATTPAATRGSVPTTYPSPGSGTTQTPIATLDAYTTSLGYHNIAPVEDLIAFCSTLNPQNTTTPQPYYFQRQNPDSPQADWLNIGRNQMMASYLRAMVQQKEPGFGASLEGSWGGTNADWITLECMDYCRSMINQYTYDPSATGSTGKLLYSFSGVQGLQVNLPSGGGQSYTERMAQTVVPLRVNPASGANVLSGVFDGTAPSNNTGAGIGSAGYLTQGAYPSLKEVALQFIAQQRMAPAYIGPKPVAAGGPGPDMSFDPFYWVNLINCGAGPIYSTAATATHAAIPPVVGQNDFFGPTVPSITALPSGSTYTGGTWPDGIVSSTSASNYLEQFDMYPVGCQTTQMRGYLLFDFAGLRDGSNAAPNPSFWVKVTGTSGWSVKTGNPAGSVKPFPDPLIGEYRARSGYGATDCVFQAMKGGNTFTNASKSFLPGTTTGSPVQNLGNYPFCSNFILCAPSDVNFGFGGGTINVAIYAEYGIASGKTPDTDPTGDTTQFVTSYNITGFGNDSGALPMPIAPRWNVRQSESVPYPYPTHVLTYYTTNSAGALVTNTVPIASLTPGQTNVTSWVATEMVPEIRNIGNYSWSISPTPNTSGYGPNGGDHPDVRDLQTGMYYANTPFGAQSNTVTPLDGLQTTGVNWMMYATIYNTGTMNTLAYTNTSIITNSSWVISGNNTNTFEPIYVFPTITTPASSGTTTTILTPVLTGYQATPQSGTLVSWSMNYSDRLIPMSGTMVSAEGTPVPTTSADNGGGAFWTNTTFNSGGGGVPNYPGEGFTEITPYDTVISCMVDPQSGNLNGDPRLINAQGENVLFNDDGSVVKHFDSSLSAATVLNDVLSGSNGWTTLLTTSGGSAVAGVYPFPRSTYEAQAHQLGNPSSQQFMTGYQVLPVWGTNLTLSPNSIPQYSRYKNIATEGVYGGNSGLGSSETYASWVGLDTNAFLELNLDWDWTSSPGYAMDGGYLERPDQDYQSFYTAANMGIGLGTPYFARFGPGASGVQGSNTINYSPNRQVPSPVQFGTLPSSMTVGWQTLAFSPNQAYLMDGGSHAGVASTATGSPIQMQTPTATGAPYTGTGVPDHLLLDLFWMPVAEPYPISEQFSTAGKINLNYAMMPFPYIQRKSGMDAVLKSVWIYALPNTYSGQGTVPNIPQDYKAWAFMSAYNSLVTSTRTSNPNNVVTTRYPINVDQTLKTFDTKFADGDIFRSASQICDVFLYPNSRSAARTPATDTVLNAQVTWDSANANITAFWKDMGMLTSDNGREQPYNAIYSRVTTQSNTFMVHWRVQSLHKLTTNGSTPSVWVEGVDRITSELRGSTLIERYLDPNAGATTGATGNSIPDYANPSTCVWNTSGTGWTGSSTTAGTTYPITYYYKWRVENETYFQPQP